MRNFQSNSLAIFIMATLTLALAVIIPAITRGQASGSMLTGMSSLAPSAKVENLLRSRSAVNLVAGGTFVRGGTIEMFEGALIWCSENAGSCDSVDMQNSSPPHRVSIDTFWMEITEVTVRQYVAFLNAMGSEGHLEGCYEAPCMTTNREDPKSQIVYDGQTYLLIDESVGDLPVNNVTWFGARAYCASVARRLPTDAEWEYAARGVQGLYYPWGNEWDPSRANVYGSILDADGGIVARPGAVGGYPAGSSRDGIRDLAGNAAEWTADWYDPRWYQSIDATRANDPGPDVGEERIVRGGSWNTPWIFAFSARRHALDPYSTAPDVGFRCVEDE